jgi:hypothetical protein
MSSLTNYYEAVLLTLESEIPELREVRAYRDEFDGDDVRRIGVSLPGALVAVDMPEVMSRTDGRVRADVNVAVAVMTREASNSVSDMQAMAIAEKIAVLIYQNRFGGTAASDPANMGVNNDNSEKTRKRGVSLWTVSWTQGVFLSELGDIVIPELEFVTDADLSPETTITSLGSIHEELGNGDG